MDRTNDNQAPFHDAVTSSSNAAGHNDKSVPLETTGMNDREAHSDFSSSRDGGEGISRSSATGPATGSNALETTGMNDTAAHSNFSSSRNGGEVTSRSTTTGHVTDSTPLSTTDKINTITNAHSNLPTSTNDLSTSTNRGDAPRGSLASTSTSSDPNTETSFPASTTGQAVNAPGKTGVIGENVMGALGYGGSAVERPKEDRGIGEKVAEFLGA